MCGLVLIAGTPVTTAQAAAPGATVFTAGSGEIGADVSVTRFDPDLTDERGDRYALRGGAFIGRQIQWEAEITRATAREELFSGAEKRITLALAVANVVVNFYPGGRTVPYVLAGMGVGQMKLEAIGLSSRETATAYQIAGGCRFFIGRNNRAAARLELALLANEGFDERYVHASLGAGMTFRLGQ
ncbi:MAG TPA: outer membrane beta-barrel protein [Candidatus Polarisedimenticolia bacterium]|nr:outer membrane beta-barrel protein [Candidatus Polarisedimenticolia bacterium]